MRQLRRMHHATLPVPSSAASAVAPVPAAAATRVAEA